MGFLIKKLDKIFSAIKTPPMNFLKPFLTLLTTALLFSITAMGNTSEKRITNAFLENQGVKKAIQTYLSTEHITKNNEERIGLVNLLNQIKVLQQSDAKSGNLKSTSANTHQLDSLLVERLNETSASLELAQFEKWTWYENGLGESWELYDLDRIPEKWSPNDREEYEWDENGNKTLHIDYDPDTINGGWLLNAKISNTFDPNNNLLNSSLQFLNHSNDTWENNRLQNFTYDNNGNEIESIVKVWDTISNAWVNSDKGVTSYDENGRMIKNEVLVWDTTQKDWVISMFMRSEYDENGYESLLELAINEYFMRFLTETVNDSLGNNLEVISYSWNFFQNTYSKSLKNLYEYTQDSLLLWWSHQLWNTTDSSWTTDWENHYEYDAQANLIYRDRYVQSITADTLIPYWKIDYVNNLEGKPILTNIMNWKTEKNEWVNSSQEHINYDEAQHQTYFGRYYWDTSDSKWIPNYVKIYEHDSYGNFLFQSKQNYDKESKLWVDEYSDEYNYDLGIEFSKISYPSEWPLGHLSNLYRFDNYNHAMLQKTYSEAKNDQLEVTERLTFYYSPIITTGTPEIAEAKFKVYPNPAITHLVFEPENHSVSTLIEIYDLQGRKVIAQKLPTNHLISVSDLDSGVYVYVLIQGREMRNGKFVKR